VEKKFSRASGLEKNKLRAHLDRQRGASACSGEVEILKIVFDGALKLIFTGVRF
jgi:hypothetical protein